jgi:hypothetical protein
MQKEPKMCDVLSAISYWQLLAQLENNKREDQVFGFDITRQFIL